MYLYLNFTHIDESYMEEDLQLMDKVEILKPHLANSVNKNFSLEENCAKR